ncbi:MAG: ATP-binding protein [Pseudomonadota bacterium]
MGLTLVRNIVELHNGEIKVESESGKGTIISIALPTESVLEPLL